MALPIYKLIGNRVGNLIYKLHLNLPIETNKMENYGETTKLTLAKTKSESLRTTVPISITRQFSLKAGDRIGWKIEVRNGELVVVIRPVQSNKKSTSIVE